MKYTPKEVVKSFDEVDFIKLYEKGYRIIISDLDNTLAPYTMEYPSNDLINKIEQIKSIGFKIYLVSNNNQQRLETFSKAFNIDGYLEKANKPKIKKLTKYLKELNVNTNLVIGLGDQLVTDILAFNRLNVYSILVKTIDSKTQKWYTKINRIREKNIIKQIKKENIEIGRKLGEL